jgi:hypothetical protein
MGLTNHLPLDGFDFTQHSKARKVLRSCITAYLVGMAYHSELAQAAVRDLGKHCDNILDTAFQTDHFSTCPDMPECDDLAPALAVIYDSDVTVDTIPIRQILVPFLWIFERGADHEEVHSLAETNDKFAADMGRYILFMKNQGTPWEPKGRSHQVRTHYQHLTGDSHDMDPGCAGCGGSVNRKESETESENDEEMESEGESESDEEMEIDQESEQESLVGDHYRPVMFDPFVTVLTWKHVRYWCGQCYYVDYYEKGTEKAIWRLG